MTYTWKVVYYLPSSQWSGGNNRGVAFVEAATQPEASWAFAKVEAAADELMAALDQKEEVLWSSTKEFWKLQF